MKNKHVIILLFSLLIPFSLIFSACNANAVEMLIITIGGEQGSYIERVYGEVDDLKNYSVTAIHKNNSKKDVTKECVISVISPSGDMMLYSDYVAEIDEKTLDYGTWTLVFSYNNFSQNYKVNITKPANPNSYSLNITSLISGQEDLNNTLYYGTRETGYKISIIVNPGEDEYEYNSPTYFSLYQLKPEIDYSKDLTPESSILNPCQIDELSPGIYYVCYMITDYEYKNAYSSFTRLTILKNKFIVDASDLSLEWTFSENSTPSDIKFADMLNEGIDYEGGKLIVCSDFDDTNNDEESYMNKATRETVTEYMHIYGKFEFAGTDDKFNASDDVQTITLKLSPLPSMSNLFEASDAFEASIKINKGELIAPNPVTNCCENEHSYYPNKTHYLTLNSLNTDVYSIISTATQTSEENNYTFSTTLTELSVTLKLKNTNNFMWANNSYFDNVNINVNSNTGELTYSLNIQKGNLNDYAVIKAISGSFELSANGTIDLVLTNSVDNETYLDGNYTWEVLPAGTNVDGSVSIANGKISSINGINGTCKKRLTVTDVLAMGQDFDYVTIAIKITANESDLWNAYSKTFILVIKK